MELLLEQKRTLEVEEKQSQLSQHHEQVVSDLESKLSQLSAAVGDYEHVRWQDQANSKKLQERIAQLQLENSTLTQLVQSRGDVLQGEGEGDEGEADVQRLVERILKLKTKLKAAYEKTQSSVDVEGEKSVGCGLCWSMSHQSVFLFTTDVCPRIGTIYWVNQSKYFWIKLLYFIKLALLIL